MEKSGEKWMRENGGVQRGEKMREKGKDENCLQNKVTGDSEGKQMK